VAVVYELAPSPVAFDTYTKNFVGAFFLSTNRSQGSRPPTGKILAIGTARCALSVLM
jgi:hypothetical protein